MRLACGSSKPLTCYNYKQLLNDIQWIYWPTQVSKVNSAGLVLKIPLTTRFNLFLPQTPYFLQQHPVTSKDKILNFDGSQNLPAIQKQNMTIFRHQFNLN